MTKEEKIKVIKRVLKLYTKNYNHVNHVIEPIVGLCSVFNDMRYDILDFPEIVEQAHFEGGKTSYYWWEYYSETIGWKTRRKVLRNALNELEK